MSTNATVFLLDEDRARLEGRRQLFEDGGFCVAACRCSDEFLDLYDPRTTGCLVVEGSNLEAALTSRLHEYGWAPPVLALTPQGDVEAAVRAFKRGASEVLERPFSLERVSAEVQDLLERDAAQMQQRLLLLDVRRRLESLSPREREALGHMMRGRTSRQTAAVLDISVRTVEAHRSNIMRKMQANSAAELIRQATFASVATRGWRGDLLPFPTELALPGCRDAESLATTTNSAA